MILKMNDDDLKKIDEAKNQNTFFSNTFNFIRDAFSGSKDVNYYTNGTMQGRAGG